MFNLQPKWYVHTDQKIRGQRKTKNAPGSQVNMAKAKK